MTRGKIAGLTALAFLVLILVLSLWIIPRNPGRRSAKDPDQTLWQTAAEHRQ